MFGLAMLDVLIGLITIYLAFGLACTAIVEAVAAWLSIRSNNLESAIGELFAGNLRDGQSFADAFFKHPVVQALSKGSNGKPSYIQPAIVSQVVQALVDTVKSGNDLMGAIDALPGTSETNRVKGLLKTLAAEAQGDVKEFKRLMEFHFNATMERASGWYKRYTQKVALCVAFALVVAVNVDTVALVTSLASDPIARAKLVEVAEQRLADAQKGEQSVSGNPSAPEAIAHARQETAAAREAVERAANDLSATGLQLGWRELPKSFLDIAAKLVGLLVSVFAISLGAPFWFDVLQRFMQVRATGRPPVSRKKK